MTEKSLKKGDVIELEIESVAFGGEGVGKVMVPQQTAEGLKPKAFAVFVEDTVQGDVVKVQINHKKKNWARGFVKELTTPSKLRIQPRCMHFGSALENGKVDLKKGCGGCTLQYLSYEDQLKLKERQVRDAIRRIGGLQDEVVLPILGVQEPWFYRNKMEFSFSKNMDVPANQDMSVNQDVLARQNASHSVPPISSDKRLGLGLHLKRRHHDVVELEECFLLGKYVGVLVKEARAFFRDFAARGTDGSTQTGRLDPDLTLKSLTVREGKNTGEIMVILTAENGTPEFDGKNFVEDFKEWLLDFFEREKLPLTSFYFVHTQNRAGQRNTSEEKLIYGQPVIHEQLHLEDGQILKFQISPLAFFQPNTKQAQVLYSKVLEAAALKGDEIVYDLFCGTGTIGIFCARHARKVYGIEINASALENARKNAELNEVQNIDFVVGDVDQQLGKLNQSRAGDLAEKPDVVIVDPPRNGMEPKVVEKVAAFRASRLVYVSCNPTTLARDAALLIKTGYRLVSVQPVDMFPQTYHIENVALFERI